MKNDSIKLMIQHYLNPLHVYCRLIDIGLSQSIAKWSAKKYEGMIFNIFFISKENTH